MRTRMKIAIPSLSPVQEMDVFKNWTIPKSHIIESRVLLASKSCPRI